MDKHVYFFVQLFPAINFSSYFFQFIVVSLKDGMFNNANVLYKTKFVDGVSTVTRYVQNASRSTSVSSNKENERTGKKKATTKRARIEEST